MQTTAKVEKNLLQLTIGLFLVVVFRIRAYFVRLLIFLQTIGTFLELGEIRHYLVLFLFGLVEIINQQ